MHYVTQVTTLAPLSKVASVHPSLVQVFLPTVDKIIEECSIGQGSLRYLCCSICHVFKCSFPNKNFQVPGKKYILSKHTCLNMHGHKQPISLPSKLPCSREGQYWYISLDGLNPRNHRTIIVGKITVNQIHTLGLVGLP